MREGITLNSHDQTRLKALLDLEADRMTIADVSELLGVTERRVRGLLADLRSQGAAGLIHGNRGRAPANACSPEVAARVLELWQGKYLGFNQVFFAEMLEREEGILVSRSTVRRLLAAHGIAAASPQKRSRHRSHRQRRAQAGAMIQMDGSNHDWLGEGLPRLTLVGGIDDATGHVWATFRLGEDTMGYFEVISQIVAERGIPCSIYTDLTTIAMGTKRTPERVQNGTVHFDTQLTRVLKRLGVVLIRAHSPQAKGRIERLWRTLQDRLLCELRAKQVRTIEGAQAVLSNHLKFHNRNFEVVARDPIPAWSPLPQGVTVADAIVWTYPRTVSNANTVSVEGTLLQLNFLPAHPGWNRRKVIASRRIDGTWFATFLGQSVPASTVAQPSKSRAA